MTVSEISTFAVGWALGAAGGSVANVLGGVAGSKLAMISKIANNCLGFKVGNVAAGCIVTSLLNKTLIQQGASYGVMMSTVFWTALADSNRLSRSERCFVILGNTLGWAIGGCLNTMGHPVFSIIMGSSYVIRMNDIQERKNRMRDFLLRHL